MTDPVTAPAENAESTQNTEAATTQQTQQQQQTDYRPKLSDEEQLEVLEGRVKRLKTKLGKNEEPAQGSSSDSNDLLQKAFLNSAGLSDPDEQTLAQDTAKKWNVRLDELVNDEDWKIKLEKHRTTKANEAATSQVQGSGNTQGSSQTVEHWLAKGVPPTPEQVPDRKLRAQIARGLMAAEKNGGQFYNSAK